LALHQSIGNSIMLVVGLHAVAVVATSACTGRTAAPPMAIERRNGEGIVASTLLVILLALAVLAFAWEVRRWRSCLR
jgi:hypothetical protein